MSILSQKTREEYITPKTVTILAQQLRRCPSIEKHWRNASVDWDTYPTFYINPYNADNCLYQPWRPKGLFNLKAS